MAVVGWPRSEWCRSGIWKDEPTCKNEAIWRYLLGGIWACGWSRYAGSSQEFPHRGRGGATPVVMDRVADGPRQMTAAIGKGMSERRAMRLVGANSHVKYIGYASGQCSRVNMVI